LETKGIRQFVKDDKMAFEIKEQCSSRVPSVNLGIRENKQIELNTNVNESSLESSKYILVNQEKRDSFEIDGVRVNVSQSPYPILRPDYLSVFLMGVSTGIYYSNLQKALSISDLENNTCVTVPTKLGDFITKARTIGPSEIVSQLEAFSNHGSIDELRKNLSENELIDFFGCFKWIQNEFQQYDDMRVSIALDPETGEFEFVSIIINDCGWDEWGVLIDKIQTEMESVGLDELSSKVAIICPQALLE
jgi:hypothetical protein